MVLKKLKSGTDLRGNASEGGGEIDLTDEAVKAAVMGYVYFLTKKLDKGNLKIALGHDSRLSSDRICAAAAETLKKAGCEIFDCGLCSTPSMFMMTKYPDTLCDGAIMATASHHPHYKNGLKFFTPDGGVSSAELDEIIRFGEEGAEVTGSRTVTYKKDFMRLYADTLVEKVRAATGEETPLAGLKIVVDAGNGAGGFYAERVLAPLGADTAGSQFLEPDGRFPNHVPNPEDPKAMEAISRCVKDNRADLGVIFDTDVDRSAVVASDGTEINRNRLIALVSAILLEENPGATIVTDSVTSDGLTDFIGRRGGIHHRYKRGYRNVIDEAIKLGKEGKNVPLAIETSGHAALKENYYLDDGAYLVTRLLIKMAQLNREGKKLTDLTADLAVPRESREIRLTFKTPDFSEYGKMIIDKLTAFAASSLSPAPSNYEGIRANVPYAEGWFLVRMSVHDPIMPINIESDKAGGVKLIAKLLYAFLSPFTGLDATNLQIVAQS